MRQCNYPECVHPSGITVIIHHTDRPDETLEFCSEWHVAAEFAYRGGCDPIIFDEVERRRALSITGPKARVA